MGNFSDTVSFLGLIISIIGLIVTASTYFKAKSAAESAKQAASIAKEKAKNYSDHLLLHRCQRIINLVDKLSSIENKNNQRDISVFIRHEINDIRNGIVTISRDQKIFFQEFITFLTLYQGENYQKDTLDTYKIKFNDLISKLTHNEGDN